MTPITPEIDSCATRLRQPKDQHSLGVIDLEITFVGELNTTLHRLTLEQHLLAGMFLIGYGAALGSMFSSRGRQCAALAALLAAVGFAASTHPWEHGVLLVGGAIGGVAVFIALAWAISRVAAYLGASWQSTPATTAGIQPAVAGLRRSAAVLTARTATQIARRRRRRARTV